MAQNEQTREQVRTPRFGSCLAWLAGNQRLSAGLHPAVLFHGSAGNRAGHLQSCYPVLNTLSKSCPVCTHCRGQLSSETALCPK